MPLKRVALTLVCALLSVAACHDVEHLLNGPPPTDARFDLALSESRVTLAKGAETAITATLTQTGDYYGDAPFSATGLPSGVTATISNVSKVNRVTTSKLTLRVANDVALAAYVLVVHAHVDGIPDANATIALTVVDAPALALAASTRAFTIARGGVADGVIGLARVNLTAPVVLTLEGAGGITAAFAPTASPDSVPYVISVASTVAPGAYSLSIRGSAPPAPEQLLPIVVTVTADAVQLIAPAQTTLAQGASTSTQVIVNSAFAANAIALSVEGLPAGVNASFSPSSQGGGRTALVLTASPATVAGIYAATIRAKAAGAPDATTALLVRILAASAAITIAPQALALVAGSSTSLTAAIARAEYAGDVIVAAESVPTGITLAPSPAIVTGTTASLTLNVSAGVAPGAYSISLRATPAGFPVSASGATTVAVTVQSLAAGTGNVTLDWSRCDVPAWIAGQDGTGPWSQLAPDSHVARFNVTANVGAFAFANPGSGATVRFLTRGELTAVPLDLCATVASKRISGAGVQNGGTVPTTFSMGGATTASTGVAPAFTLAGVADGPQDLIATQSPSRGLIRRDQNIPDGGSLGVLDVNGSESYPLDRATFSIVGPVLAAEQMTYQMSLFTSPSCVQNPMYSGGFGTANFSGNLSFTTSMPTVPAAYQRATDFHLFTMYATSGSSSRSAAMTFKITPISFAMPGLVESPVITTLGGNYVRLQTSFPAVPAQYNGDVVLEYGPRATLATVQASRGFLGNSAVTIAMPDFSGVQGWKTSYAPAGGVAGTWVVSLSGATDNGARCTDRRTSVTATRSGVY